MGQPEIIPIRYFRSVNFKYRIFCDMYDIFVRLFPKSRAFPKQTIKTTLREMCHTILQKIAQMQLK